MTIMVHSSVADPDSLNPYPDAAFQVNPDQDKIKKADPHWDKS